MVGTRASDLVAAHWMEDGRATPHELEVPVEVDANALVEDLASDGVLRASLAP